MLRSLFAGERSSIADKRSFIAGCKASSLASEALIARRDTSSLADKPFPAYCLKWYDAAACSAQPLSPLSSSTWLWYFSTAARWAMLISVVPASSSCP